MNEIMLAASKILIPQSLEATVTPVSKKVFVINTPVMRNGVLKLEFRFLKHLHFLIHNKRFNCHLLKTMYLNMC